MMVRARWAKGFPCVKTLDASTRFRLMGARPYAFGRRSVSKPATLTVAGFIAFDVLLPQLAHRTRTRPAFPLYGDLRRFCKGRLAPALTAPHHNMPGNVSAPVALDERKPMQFTLGEAARHCGVAKGTISKAIRSGKLSATRREDGSWSIDGAELARYLEANRHRFRSETQSETVQADQLETDSKTDALVAALHELIAQLKRENTSLEQDRDEWREQAKRLVLPVRNPRKPQRQPRPHAPAACRACGQGRMVVGRGGVGRPRR